MKNGLPWPFSTQLLFSILKTKLLFSILFFPIQIILTNTLKFPVQILDKRSFLCYNRNEGRDKRGVLTIESKKLDYSLKTMKERAEFIEALIPTLTPEQLNNKRYLEILGDYVIAAMTPAEKKAHLYLTENRKLTINKRETSYQGLTEQFENGEDGAWNLFNEVADKSIRLTQKKEISAEDLAEIPELRNLKESIAIIEKLEAKAQGKDRYRLKKWLIELHQEQYIIKDIFKPTMSANAIAKSVVQMDLGENITIDENGEPQSNCRISLFNPTHVCALLCNYSALKEESWSKFSSDLRVPALRSWICGRCRTRKRLSFILSPIDL